MFYASASKILKKEFGDTLLVTHLRLKPMFNKPQMKPNNRSALQEFHQQIKLNITWLSLLGYKRALYSYDSVTKTTRRLPFNLRKEFCKDTKDVSLTDGTLNLILFESWLDQVLYISDGCCTEVDICYFILFLF